MTKLKDSSWLELQESLTHADFLTSANPVITRLSNGSLDEEKGKETLRQYFYLVTTIVQFLTIAMVRIPVAKVKKELKRNLGEELGSRTNNQPHQEILERLLLNELGMSVRSPWNEETRIFISTLLLAFNTRQPRFIAGMVYALEATACPELIVVAQIINLAAKKEVVVLESLSDRNDIQRLKKGGEVKTLQDFLALHTLDFELGHESGLRTTLQDFIQQDWQQFRDGYDFVLRLMHDWWHGLAKA
jgi:hypothetical protein